MAKALAGKLRATGSVLGLTLGLTVGLIGLTPSAASAQSQLGSSFDCSRDTTTTISLICNNNQLQRADLHQLQAYYTFRHAAPDQQQDARAYFVSEIRQLRAECDVGPASAQSACVTRRLESLRETWLTRVAATRNPAAVEEAKLTADELLSLQSALRDAGYLPPNSLIDGVFGTATRTAIARFQIDRGIQPTGFATLATVRAVRLALAPGQIPLAESQAPQNHRERQDGNARLPQQSTAVQSVTNERHAYPNFVSTIRHIQERISHCWRVDPGTLAHPDVVVELRVQVDERGVVRSIMPGETRLDGYLSRALFQSAQRALSSSQCMPLYISDVIPDLLYFNSRGLLDASEFIRRRPSGYLADFERRAIADRERREVTQRVEELSQRLRRAAEDRRREVERTQQEERRAQEEQLRRNNQEAISVLARYRSRQKTLLEQVINYTQFAQEEGLLNPVINTFWVSGHNGAHRCVLTKITAVDEQMGLLHISGAREAIDIRDFNQQGFRILWHRGGQIVVGDERRQIPASPEAVMSRLETAWGLAFRECPGRRSAF